MDESDKQKEADSKVDALAVMVLILLAVATVSFFVYQPV